MRFRVEMLRLADYLESPWEQLMHLLARADGVVGLVSARWTSVTDCGAVKRAQVETVRAVWTSPWMHVEAGMAIASNKPVLAAPERGVTEGVFAQHNWTDNVFGAMSSTPARPPSSAGRPQCVRSPWNAVASVDA